MPPKRGPPGGRARASAAKSARHVPARSPTEADRLAKDELRAAAAALRPTALPPLSALAPRLPGPATLGGLVAPQYHAGSPAASRGPRALARPGAAPVSCAPVGPPGSALASQANLSSDVLQQPRFYLHGAARPMAPLRAANPAPDGTANGSFQGFPGPLARGPMAPDVMSQLAPFPRPVTPPPVRMAPAALRDAVLQALSLQRLATAPPSGATHSSLLPPPGPGPVEYATGETLPMLEGRAPPAAPAVVAPPSSAASPGIFTGQGNGSETQYLNIDGTGVDEEALLPSAAAVPVTQPESTPETRPMVQGPAPRPRSTRAPRRRAVVGVPPAGPAVALGSTRTAASPSASVAAGRTSLPSNSTRTADGGAAVSSGTPVRSPAASATHTRRGPSTPGSTINLSADTPTIDVDKNNAATLAAVRALTPTITSMATRLDRLEGAVRDSGRRLQTQGASFESLAKVVSALRSAITEGLDTMKVLHAEVTSTSNKPSSAVASGASSALLPADRGILTGRAVRGAAPGFQLTRLRRVCGTLPQSVNS